MSFIPGVESDPNNNPYANLSSPTSFAFPRILDFNKGYELFPHGSRDEILLGVDGQGEPITTDLNDGSPHILVSASTGGGKSVILRGVAAQILANGGVATFLDYKRHSQRWAKNLPNARYAQNLPDICRALLELGREVHRRNLIIDNWPGPVETAPVGPRIVVVFEEMTATMDLIKELTKSIPTTDYNALHAFRDVVFLGRAARMHVVGVGQFMDARTMGGSAIRECFNTRILIDYSKQTWTMLAYDCGRPQAAPSQLGRGMVCRGGKARQTQFLYLTEEEAAAMARSAYAVTQPASVPQIGR